MQSIQDPAAPSGAVILLSGGLDSATVLAMAHAQQYQLHTIAFDYGQRHRIELERSRRIAGKYNCDHRELRIDPGLFLGTALVDPKLNVPDYDPSSTGIPITYVPARNALFLAHALSLAESLQAAAIFIGVNALDYSGYPDCRPEFITAFQAMARLGTRTGLAEKAIRIETPLIQMSKAEIIRTGAALGVDYGLTSSCYNPDLVGRPCQKCASCALRAKGFAEAGLLDPLMS
ncbi:MAG: 7-cyano-7-deazaguanine synthase QueC [Leptospiraceae bacterium]|nr:7-cyano-7-deazaguanine synthase QueC [Leptospiraceae bacterium]